MKQIKKENKRKQGINFIIVILSILVLGYCAVQLTGSYLDYQEADNEYQEIKNQYVKKVKEPGTENKTREENKMENPIDFKRLEEKNADTIAWLEIKALGISYPVMQATDNEYYLNHTFEKKEHFAGSIFADERNKQDFTDENVILYGHNMKDGSMFGKLKRFQTQSTYDQDPYIWIYTSEFIYQYEIFSCREISLNAPEQAYQIEFQNKKELTGYMKEAARDSLVQPKGNITQKENRMITLSTCTKKDAARFVVQGNCVAVYESK